MADASGGVPPRMPRRPVVGSISAALRPFRHRLRQTSEAIDRGRQGSQRDTARELVQVIDNGHIPTQADRVFIGQVTAIDCDDSEGAIPTFTPDTGQAIPVIVIRNPAVAGDLLIAHAIAGRWVAERGGVRTKVCVVACGKPVVAALVEVLDGSGAVLASCTTGVAGCCQIDASGTHRVRVTLSGSVVFDGTRTVSGTVTVFLSNDAVVCCGPYAIPKHLTLTDAAGSIDFIFDPNESFPIWYGGHSVQRTSCPATTPNNVCVVGPPSTGPVRVCYQMVCFSGQDPAFSIQRSWSWVFKQGTLDPIWFQDDSGTTPGLPCVTSPPAICGSPLTDTAGADANPSSTSPFVLSCTPVPADANSTADPLGGGIVISA